MITDFLLIGRANAQTARELADLLSCNVREITAGIERERKRGAPIVASCDHRQPGYYLAEDPEEIELYCNQLRRRAAEINKTGAALFSTAQRMKRKRRL